MYDKSPEVEPSFFNFLTLIEKAITVVWSWTEKFNKQLKMCYNGQP